MRVAKQPSSETYNLPLKSQPAPQARGVLGLSASTRFDAQTCVLIIVSVMTGYLVLPPLYSVLQTSLFTTKLTGELDEFTLRYYEELFRELQVFGTVPQHGLFFHRQRAVRHDYRRDRRLGRDPDRYTAAGLGIFHRFRLFRHAVYFIHHRLVAASRQSRTGELLAAHVSQSKRAGGECLFAVGNGLSRIFSLVAVRVFDAGRFLPLHGPVARRGVGGLRRAALADARRVSLRLMLPAFFSVILLIFIRAFESFEIPALVGLPGDIRVLTTSIYLDSQRMPPTYGRAGAFSVLLDVGRGGHAVFLFRESRGRGTHFTPLPAKDTGPPSSSSAVGATSRHRRCCCSIPSCSSCCRFSLFSGPRFCLSIFSLRSKPFRMFTLKNFITAIHFPKITDSIKNSVLLGLGSATVVMLLTTFASWILVRTKLRGRWLLDLLTTLAAVVSRYCDGLGDHALLSDRADSHLRHAVDFAGGFYYALHSLRHSLHPLRPPSAPSRIGGSSLYFRGLVVKCHAAYHDAIADPVFLGRLGFYFLLSAKELSMSILLVSPQTPVVSVAIYELWENGQVGELAAFGVIWTTILVSIAVAYYLFARRYGIQQQ